nr:immunoglobulin heavy chain junction region [Macaca mulatta]MOV54699.1 immunoglobulin heavy chain junction region [Macaca mulatta]MOV54974.1 immunoglobulin heavy chain junction region [Macaca mulatta]MOV55494.1 immunoglobulin heavy chain junction region [Macaca mulatta]MOV55777.1 immunoglobulin heavy chain junction region [Macaca mulatta]
CAKGTSSEDLWGFAGLDSW